MQRYVPFYDPDQNNLHISYCWLYELNEYRGYPLSTSGYETEEEAIEALKSADLPGEVLNSLNDYLRAEGHAYIGLLD